MNGQGSDICIHNNKVCDCAPADRINIIMSPRSAKAVEDASCGLQDARRDSLIENIQSFAIEEMRLFIFRVRQELNLQFETEPPQYHHP